MEVKLAKVVELGDIIKMVEKHPNPEYSCDFETYAKYLLWSYNQKQFMFFVMKNGKNIIGYMILKLNIGILDKNLMVFDIFIEEEFRGKGYIKYFIQTMAVEFMSNDVNRFRFSSRQLPEEYWKKLIPCKYYTDIVYSVYKKDYKEVT